MGFNSGFKGLIACGGEWNFLTNTRQSLGDTDQTITLLCKSLCSHLFLYNYGNSLQAPVMCSKSVSSLWTKKMPHPVMQDLPFSAVRIPHYSPPTEWTSLIPSSTHLPDVSQKCVIFMFKSSRFVDLELVKMEDACLCNLRYNIRSLKTN